MFIEFYHTFNYSRVRMVTIIPIASGKGGVGKTIFTANLGCALASYGKTVILIDLDLGGSNLHTCLGVKNRHPGIGNYIYRREDNLESLIIETNVSRLFFIPGDSLLPGTANLQYFLKKRIIREIPDLPADFILLDLPGGSTYNTVDFFLMSNAGIIVTIPQITAILNAYSFLKSALFRLLYRSFPPKSMERQKITEFATSAIENTPRSFRHMAGSLSELSDASAATATRQLSTFLPRIVLNMGGSRTELALGSKLRQIVRKNLSVEVEYIGFIAQDNIVDRSIVERKPAFLIDDGCDFSKSISRIGEKLIASPEPGGPVLYEGDEDLGLLLDEYKTL